MGTAVLFVQSSFLLTTAPAPRPTSISCAYSRKHSRRRKVAKGTATCISNALTKWRVFDAIDSPLEEGRVSLSTCAGDTSGEGVLAVIRIKHTSGTTTVVSQVDAGSRCWWLLTCAHTRMRQEYRVSGVRTDSLWRWHEFCASSILRSIERARYRVTVLLVHLSGISGRLHRRSYR